MQLEPEQAFGDYDENTRFLESRTRYFQLTPEGMTFDGATYRGSSHHSLPEFIYTVTEICRCGAGWKPTLSRDRYSACCQS
jgi:FKBP-type peptidyl-prolyl cis-trans isomerase SlyD